MPKRHDDELQLRAPSGPQQNRHPDDSALCSQRSAEYVDRVLAQAPALTPDQLSRLRSLLHEVRPVAKGARR